MIQINVATNTRDENGNSGLPVLTGVLLNITPHFRDRVDEDGATIYSVSFDAVVFKDMASYEANDVLINSDMFEYPVGHTIDNVDVQAFTSIDDVLDLYRAVIENGSGEYAGVGSGNTALVYPS